jgi:hypothetical protein
MPNRGAKDRKRLRKKLAIQNKTRKRQLKKIAKQKINE